MIAFGAVLTPTPGRTTWRWFAPELRLNDLNRHADRLDRAFGTVVWGVDDVVSEFGVTHDEASEYLTANDNHLSEGQTEKG